VPRLSLIVPALNEADNVQGACDEIAAAFASLGGDYEVIFVDDGSTDGTADRVLAARATMPQLRLLQHAERFGKAVALRNGVTAARSDWVATIDGDRQDDPTQIPLMLATAEAAGPPWPVVIGVRVGRRDESNKRIASRIANGLRRRVLDDDCPDTTSPTKVFRREDYLRLPHFNGQHRFLPALFQYDGKRVIAREVSHRPRTAGISKYNNLNRALVGIWDLVGVVWLRTRSTKPGRVTEL
jgi:dolichol-phosphate mannosyltransferase